jgi:hypothetical protein
MFNVKRCIIFRQERVARVSKNTFDEIQIAHEISRNKKSHFQSSFRRETGNFRANERTQKQRDETFRRFFLSGGEWQPHQIARRIEREHELMISE